MSLKDAVASVKKCRSHQHSEPSRAGSAYHDTRHCDKTRRREIHCLMSLFGSVLFVISVMADGGACLSSCQRPPSPADVTGIQNDAVEKFELFDAGAVVNYSERRPPAMIVDFSTCEPAPTSDEALRLREAA